MQTFFLEGEVLGVGPRLVVSSQHEERVGTAYFPDKQVENHLNTEVSSVHVIPQEEILGGGWVSPHLKQLDQVVELAVDISAYCKHSS